MKRALIVFAVVLGVGIAWAAWQQETTPEANTDTTDAFARDYDTRGTSGAMVVSVENWPFDPNVNLRVSPQVLDEHVVLQTGDVVFSPGDPYVSEYVETARFTSVQARAYVTGSVACALRWRWEEDGGWFETSIDHHGNVKSSVLGRYVAFRCAPGGSGSPTLHYADLYLRAEF